MNEQKIITKRSLILVLAVILTAVAIFFFLRWLYTPDPYLSGQDADIGPADSVNTDAVEVFNYDIEKRLKLEEYSNNIYIQLLNSVLTGAKVSYEYSYGCPMPGLLASSLSNLTDGLHTDISNPLTYLNLAFTAFSQYDPALLAYNEGSEPGGNNALPDITSFEDAPEGAIYFSEQDEYTSEEAQGQPVPQENTPPQIDEENVGEPGKIEIASKSPQILIYHSHATESYMPNTAGNYHTSSEKYNMIGVGNVLAKTLQDRYKYRVVHDTTYHDKASYAYSYANSLVTIKKYLNRYKSIKVILDVHRDAFATRSEADKQARKAEYTATINGKKAARIMLVVGEGNPNYKELEKFAVYIKKKMDTLYPGLFLKINIANNKKYNEYFSNHSMLVEVGCMLNTANEAKYSAELLSKVLDEVIKDLKE
ncbi:MAG: stage II sporulation protein P [Caulobacteraceae bacterium]